MVPTGVPQGKGPRLRSLGARIAIFFVTLLILVQGLAAFFIIRANAQIARQTIAQALEQGERIFQRILAQNQLRLEQGAAILSADFAFRQAIATNNAATILSVLRNHGGRLGANVMMLVSLENEVRADTGDEARAGKPFAFPALIQQAAASGKASSIVILGHRLYQLVVVPVLAPVPIAWVGLAFEVDDELAKELQQQTALEVSFLSRGGGGWEVHASTLDPFLRAALREALSRPGTAGGSQREIALVGEDFETRLATLQSQSGTSIVAALQRPLSEGLAPFRRVSTTFFWLTFAGVLALVVGSLAIARGVTRPVQQLAEAAKRVEQGDYSHPLEVTRQKDEIGQLADSFNHMLDGIVTREREILRLAYEDGLTALPNRSMFSEQLDQAVRTARRANQSLAVLMLDMDRFKTINDTLGHPVGDQALREVGRRVRNALRDSDVVARLGGDEFAVLLATGGMDRAPSVVAQKILNTLEAPLVIDGQTMDVAASIGIARFPEHGDDANALLRAADVAMYTAKRAKRGFAVYDSSYDERRQEFLTLLGELRKAVETDQLVLQYQPKVNLADGRVTAVEALVRWQHPERGFVPPATFIPFAEQTGYISAITEWVLRKAIEQCGRWHRTGLAIKVSANVSARDLRQEDVLVRHVDEALRASQVPAGLLCLEITESGLMEDPRSAQSTLRKLRELGVATSIDDYGTGYSSLAYIKQLAVNELKIDRTFVSGMEADHSNAAIVRSTIELGHNLGLTVAAEGVETDHELAVLKQYGCDLAQGYHFSRPLMAADFEAWLARQPGSAAVRLVGG
jgi:diguanylate cyclase (GGDEF)-like protein